MTLQELKTAAQQIQNETTQNSNTAARVGGVLVRIAEELLKLITADMIQSEAITTDCIADGAVTRSKIGNSAVQAQHIVNGAVTASKIDSNAVTSGKLATAAVTTAKLASGAVTQEKLADNSVSAEKLCCYDYEALPHWADTVLLFKNGNIYKMQLNQIAKGMGDNTVERRVIATKAVGTNELDDRAVNTRVLANAAVTLEKIGNDVKEYVGDLLNYIELETEWEKAYLDESNPDSDYDVNRITGISFTKADGDSQTIEIPTASMFTDGFMSASQAAQLASLLREVAEMKTTIYNLQRLLPTPYPDIQL